MKCLSVRLIAPSLLLVGTALSPMLAWSMNEMTDSQMATTTGQDGITIVIAPPVLTAAQKNVAGQAVLTQTNGLIVGAAILHDKDGIGGFGGALIVGDARQANTLNAAGTQMGIYGSTPITVNIDASGNGAAVAATNGGRPKDGTAPVLNINVGLPTDLLIRTGDISIDASKRSVPAILVGASGATKANAAIGGTKGSAVKIMNSMDITFNGTPIAFNVQLGNTPQGGMISFGTLNIPNVTFSGISLVSPNGAGVASQLALALSISDLNLTGATVSVANDVVGAMTGTAAATPVGGLIFSDSSFTVGRVELNNVVAGNTSCGSPIPGPCISTNIAQGMANASIGSFGVSGITATNLRIGVSGM